MVYKGKPRFFIDDLGGKPPFLETHVSWIQDYIKKGGKNTTLTEVSSKPLKLNSLFFYLDLLMK